MSLRTISLNINRIQNNITDLNKKIGEHKKKEADAQSKIVSIRKSIGKNISESSLKNKQSQIAKQEEKAAKASASVADLQKRLSVKMTSLYKYQNDMNKEKEREEKKLDRLQQRRDQESDQLRERLHEEIQSMKEERNVTLTQSDTDSFIEKQYDFFISHASEDKEEFVKPLVYELKKRGFEVWYDAHTIKLGDSLRQMIDRGLANAKYGIVVLSPWFFKKNWTQFELDGLVSREMEGSKVILPIWHKISKDEVMKQSPLLAGKKAANTTDMTIVEIANQLEEVLGD
ncbi:toll/interleukin-1 receptor domain-containing protein [Saccharibacillus sp. JS10]|uniref:toll/interleukin-1 receptor domain-containing protein n=1 Tax=Saccharibacillus sp. JS10 TaxID=2950552 RepID=UPI00210F0937|nr:toll/interleukin-1 receptor domain-containing protein [Saccharibacillus sp. JS10]MCQ4085942.1 toll/interleukin-1 receptor domain-containing protein [Saccharibacillus sp. JS10]